MEKQYYNCSCYFSIIIEKICYYQIKFDLGLLSALFGMGGGPGKKIRQFSLKTEACASSYGLLQFWCFDTKGPRAAAGAFFFWLKPPPRPQALFFREKGICFRRKCFCLFKKGVFHDKKGSPHATFHLDHVKRQISSKEFD